MSIPSPNPQQNRPSVCVLSDEETRRVRRFVARVGVVHAASRALGVSIDVLAAARGFGRMQRTTRDRILSALEREEAAT